MRIRPERVAQAMRRDIADIIARTLRDPRIGTFVTVTDVEVTSDLSFARVFVSVLATGEERARTLEALAHAVPFVRRELGPRLGLREVPALRFEIDTSSERGARVDELLRKLRDGEPIPDDDPE